MLLAALIVLPMFTLPVSAVSLQGSPNIRSGNYQSSNWSGYAVTGPSGSVSDVKGSWVVPAIQGKCPSTNQYSSFWVGIDGFSSNTVEQTGTDSDCQNGAPVYYAWFEFYPKGSHLISGLTIQPGNVISAEVKAIGAGRFTVTITDTTTGQSFSTTQKVAMAKMSSAEWIAEAPYSGGILPLADFGTVNFGYDSTKISATCYATVGTTTGPIGSFGSSVQWIEMVSSSGALKAVPSSLSSDGTSFSIQWYSAGP